MNFTHLALLDEAGLFFVFSFPGIRSVRVHTQRDAKLSSSKQRFLYAMK